MKLLVISLLLLSGCTTFVYNSNSLRKACKSGVKEYSDDTVSFKCQPKNVGKDNI